MKTEAEKIFWLRQYEIKDEYLHLIVRGVFDGPPSPERHLIEELSTWFPVCGNYVLHQRRWMQYNKQSEQSDTI